MALINFANRTTSGFDEDALTTGDPGERVFNFGRLMTTGNLADGIFAGAELRDDPQFRTDRDQRSGCRWHLRARR